MKTLLKIRTSLFGAEGQSSKLVERFASNWLLNNPGGRVVSRDLTPGSVPHLTAERFQAFSRTPGERSPEQRAAVDFSDALIAELEEADVIVIAAPMYNFGVPSTLRAYFDHIGRAGVTFRYDADGAHGLLTGKKTFLMVTRGGRYAGNGDAQTAYLKQFLGFIGLTDIEWVYAEGLALGPETRDLSLGAANQSIAELESAAVAA